VNLRSAHLSIGIATVLVFLATGLYLRLNFPDLYEPNESIRYLFRANHVYIMFAGGVNVAFGLYLSPEGESWRGWLKRMGSCAVLTSPVLLVLAFFVEPPQANPVRPLTFFGALLTLAGVTAHLIGAVDWTRFRKRKPS
jgi:hypothetical protein